MKDNKVSTRRRFPVERRAAEPTSCGLDFVLMTCIPFYGVEAAMGSAGWVPLPPGLCDGTLDCWHTSNHR